VTAAYSYIVNSRDRDQHSHLAFSLAEGVNQRFVHFGSSMDEGAD
jgi:hypothetical protein